MAAATALVLTLFRVRDARVRHAAWTGMLVLMLLSPLAIAWGPKARVPLRAPEPIARVVRLDLLAPSLPAMQRSSAARPPAPRAALPAHWREITFGIYAFGVLALFARIAIGIHRVRRLLRGATAPHDSIARRDAMNASASSAIGIRSVPLATLDGTARHDYLIHAACAVPVVAGWYRPRIILPVDSRDWPVDRLAMVLAHEQAHARRRDSVVRLLSLINRAVFWFHPLAWWVHREIAALAEEACDAAAAASAHSRGAYADCLITIARYARSAGHRVEPTAIAMASMAATALTRRVRAILIEPPPSPAPPRTAALRAVGALLLLACLTATPVQTIAAFRPPPASSAASPSATGHDPFRGFDGTFVVRDDRGLVDVRYNAEHADLRFSPCSTFKLPFAIMFLENGIVRDPAEIVTYDPRLEGVVMSGPAGTAHDQTLTSAFHESANWYFDSLSRSLDRTVVQQFITRSGYGNANVHDGADEGSYWYDGHLRISANEQVRFLQRLHNGALGLSARTTGLIKEVAQVEQTPRWRLAAKTGTCRGVGEDTTTHWYVGWVERPDNTYYFALRLAADGIEPAIRERIPIARQLLTQLHILD
jgi:bla regulator protein BlaR1